MSLESLSGIKLSAPAINNSTESRVPAGTYNCRVYAADADKAPDNTARINLKLEIITPDIVTFESEQYQVAGRKFKAYIPIEETNKQYNDSYNMFKAIGLCSPSGVIELDKLMPLIEAGKMFVYVQLTSEQRKIVGPDGQPVLHPETGQPIEGGWRIGYVGPRNIVAAGPIVDGLPPVEPF